MSSVARPRLLRAEEDVPRPSGSDLPSALTPLIGREGEVAAISALLTSGSRLLTLTGPGGAGKTRLALEVARACEDDFEDGSAFVPLAPIRDPNLVAAAIAQALEIDEGGATPPADMLREWIRERHLLLVADNVEHVLASAPLLTELLAAAPRLTIIATSRVRLQVTGEQIFTVPPLAAPSAGMVPTLEASANFAAIRLFVARARAVVPGFALTETNVTAVTEVCRRLDGLPLAIELAAARVRVLSPQALLARLTNRLAILTDGPRDAPERLRTMRDAIAWSHDLLSAQEQTTFRTLAVFVGGFTLEIAHDIAAERGDLGDDVLKHLEALIDASLLRRMEPDQDEARFEMLETITAFGLEQLAARGEEVRVRDAHAQAFLALAERAEGELLGVDQEQWFTRLESERPNLRAALGWLRDRGDAERALRLAGALGLFWTWPPYIHEGREWLESILALPDSGSFPAPYAKALNAAGVLAEWQADYPRAREVLERAYHLRVALGDRLGAAEALGSLGNVALGMGDLDRAERILAESLGMYRELTHQFWEAETLTSLGSVAVARGDPRRAVEFYEASAACWRQQSGSTKLSDALGPLGWTSLLMGDLDRARRAYAECLPLDISADDHLRIGRCTRGAAGIASAEAHPDLAARLFAADAAARDEAGVPLRPSIRDELDRMISRTRQTIGGEAFAVAWEEGLAWPLSDAANAAAEIFAGRTPAMTTPVDAAAIARKRELDRVAPGLTAREIEVIRLLIAGLTDKEIAATLFVSRRTASNHVSSIRAKLAVHSRAAVVAAVRDLPI